MGGSSGVEGGRTSGGGATLFSVALVGILCSVVGISVTGATFAFGGGVTALLGATCVFSESFKIPVSQSGSSPTELLGCAEATPPGPLPMLAASIAIVGASSTSGSGCDMGDAVVL